MELSAVMSLFRFSVSTNKIQATNIGDCYYQTKHYNCSHNSQSLFCSEPKQTQLIISCACIRGCSERDSNPHNRNGQGILSPSCLPFHHRSRSSLKHGFGYKDNCFFMKTKDHLATDVDVSSSVGSSSSSSSSGAAAGTSSAEPSQRM